MTFQANVFRVLIASPSDVQAERELIVRVIQEWNDANAVERQVALLPVRWETHTTPELGRPQEIINRQIVDSCDLLIGVFWTRIGSPTDEAESGTLEEIERVASQGKLVLLKDQGHCEDLQRRWRVNRLCFQETVDVRAGCVGVDGARKACLALLDHLEGIVSGSHHSRESNGAQLTATVCARVPLSPVVTVGAVSKRWSVKVAFATSVASVLVMRAPTMLKPPHQLRRPAVPMRCDHRD
jgi:Domain of unknown function (DUF4062)